MGIVEHEDGIASPHNHSKSFTDSKVIEEDNMDSFPKDLQRPKLEMAQLKDRLLTKKQQFSSSQVQNSLNQEILQLEKRLKDQVAVRHSLERAVGCNSSSRNLVSDVSMPKPATKLIREISVLELEVVHLEQHLLSLYRKAFDQQVPTLSAPSRDEKLKSALSTPRARCLQFSKSDITQIREAPISRATFPDPWNGQVSIRDDEVLVDSGVERCHSSVSQCPKLATKTTQVGTLGKALRACHSQPLSMMEYTQNTSTNVISLAEHLGTHISDHIPETPNKISEDMIKCMASIYYKLADPPTSNHGLSSPSSSLSSMSAFSPKDMWSPGLQKDLSSFDMKLDNPFHVEGLKEFSGPYSTMVEVPCIYRDNQKLVDVEDMLMSFRSLIGRLEQVDPRKMTHEQKLAFWINIHNSLVMHAFLAYGTPQNNMKRVFLLLKAAYNVGGHIISADTIQSSILGCRMSRPGQWLRVLLSSKSKFKKGSERQAYSIDHPQPLLYFALCSGNHSDPAVRVYTPKRVFQELEMAKEEYIRATFGIRKDKKILLPKIVESFAKESALCPYGLAETVQQCLPESVRKSLKKCQSAKSSKSISWIPYNFSFRYLISKELVK